MYLIPANSKKSLLIFNAFTVSDFVILASGMSISLLLLLILPISQIGVALIAIAPGCICGFLVFPIPNYHNIITILRSMIAFYTTNQKLRWKGWCFLDGSEQE